MKPVNMQLDCRSNGDFDFFFLRWCGEMEPADELSRLVGVSEDKDSGSVIVTYRHIIERHRLTEVKIGEWVTKFTLMSAVVYVGTIDKYIGVFHGFTIRVWGHDTSDLGQAEKFTFRTPILKILIRRGKVPLIIFRNGDCVTLPYGLDHCGTFRRKGLIKENTTIADTATYTRNDTDYVCYVVDDKGPCYHIMTIPITDEVADTKKMTTLKISKIREGTEGIKITGIKLIMPSEVNPLLYITWNDGRVSNYDLITKHWKHKIHGRLLLKRKVTMSSVGKNHVFMYAKESQSEPGLIVKHVYNGSFTGEYGNQATSHSTNTDVIVCKTADLMVIADRDIIAVWRLVYDPYKRSPHFRRDNMIFKLIEDLRKPEDYLPIFGYSEVSKWKQISRYIQVTTNK